jgi:hypothetical protein
MGNTNPDLRTFSVSEDHRRWLQMHRRRPEHPAGLFAALGLAFGTSSLKEPTNLKANPLVSSTAHDFASTLALPTRTSQSYIVHSRLLIV